MQVLSNVRTAVALAMAVIATSPAIAATTPDTSTASPAGNTPSAGAAAPNPTTSSTADTDASATADAPVIADLSSVVITARRLDEARAGIETQTGASTYTISSAVIAAQPGGANVQLNQVLLQAPDVVQDSFGQLHIRGDHNDLQYRLNGIILPEGISVFGQTLDPRLIASLNLITGALPAEYGLRTAGIIDMTTQSGLLKPGGYVSLYGGSHSTLEPSAEASGSDGAFSYFVTADLLRNDLGIESPDGSSQPLHDHSTQGRGFGYFEDILDSNDRLALILGASDDEFEIPNQSGLQPGLGLEANGISDFLSNDLDEHQHELTQYAILSWQHSAGRLNFQNSLSARYTSLHFAPDWTGDLLYDGIAQNAFKDDTALAWQTDASYELSDAHTVRAGFFLQHDSATSDTTSRVLPVDATGAQTSDVPLTVIQNGKQSQEIESAYLQDEWQALRAVTINYGVRLDHYNAYSSGSQVSPRLNAVWRVTADTTVHAGYSRYFTPPPFELIGSATFTQFSGTTALPPGSNTQDTPPIAERADYYDIGIEQKLLGKSLTLGIDAYGRTAQNLIDEGQFGAPIVLTPFNYRYGRVGGVEFTGDYSIRHFSAYGNLAFQAAHGKDVESSQFNFTQDQLAYIADNYIHLDHEERVSASGGVSYEWGHTRASADAIFGTGLRDDLALPDGADVPNGGHTPSYTAVNLGLTHGLDIGDPAGPLTLRFDVVNIFDKVYLIRSGTGIGVFAPQYGARRGFFGGFTVPF
ncbi:MAG TPA: TonB-dependent receptor [Steroidobacteraceae bacterium]|nr:TonB-dependent receptor [Steroidobacteraceae bacterium]